MPPLPTSVKDKIRGKDKIESEGVRTHEWVFLGVDPGQDGGIAALIYKGDRKDRAAMKRMAVSTTKCPDTRKDVFEWLLKWSDGATACIEQVHAFPGFGPKCPKCGKFLRQQGVSSTFKFGQGYGQQLMALEAACIPYTEVTPAKWQRAVGVAAKARGETRTQHKNKLKARAQQLYPDVKVTLYNADALLIATYCYYVETGRV